MPEFWKTWNSKFRKNVSKQVIVNGHTDDLAIVACHFSNVYYQSTDDATSTEAFVCERNERVSFRANSDISVLNSLSVELNDQNSNSKWVRLPV